MANVTEIEALARKMCVADGYDPDRICFDFVAKAGPYGMTLVPPDDYLVKVWHQYVRYAEVALDARD